MQDDRQNAIKRFEISLEGVRRKNQFYQRLKEAGLMEDADGDNIDAFYDRLTAITTPAEIFFLDCEEAEDVMGEYMDRLREMSADAEEESSELAIYFW